MDPTELVAWARDAASRGEDLFQLLAIDATSSESEIRRAFRRKALTAHPDKTGDAYDPAVYERLERARDALINPASREAYDNGMRAILQKKMALDQMSDRRRRLVEDLQQREAAAANSKRAKTNAMASNPELDAMAARGRAKAEERNRMMREAEEREKQAKATAEAEAKAEEASKEAPLDGGSNSGAAADVAGKDYDERIADLERRIREKQQRKAEKKAKKTGVAAPASGTDIPIINPPPPSSTRTAESKADTEKVSFTRPAAAATTSASAFAPTTADSTSQNQLPSGPSNSRGGGFASTMARLRAAQAEKRRQAAAAAATAAPAGEETPQQVSASTAAS